jgi:hypothetical protein
MLEGAAKKQVKRSRPQATVDSLFMGGCGNRTLADKSTKRTRRTLLHGISSAEEAEEDNTSRAVLANKWVRKRKPSQGTVHEVGTSIQVDWPLKKGGTSRCRAVIAERECRPPVRKRAKTSPFRYKVSRLQVQWLIQINTITDFCLVAFCTWILNTSWFGAMAVHRSGAGCCTCATKCAREFLVSAPTSWSHSRSTSR